MKFVLPLARAIDPDLAADVEKQAVYVSIDLIALRVSPDRSSVEIEGQGDENELRAKVETFLRSMVSRSRPLERKIVHSRKRNNPALHRAVYQEMKKRGWAIELGRGQVGLTGPALLAAQAIDRRCAQLAQAQFGAVEAAYPALIPATVLGRCGYFHSFPHAVSFVSHLVEDFDRIEEFRRANAAGNLVVPMGVLPTPEACLTPAVCYHAYQSLEGEKLRAGRVLTSVGKCFRYESKNMTGLDRLWDFTMREIIFIGNETWVNAQRQAAIDAVRAQMEEWDLEGTIETANDPFFPAAYASKTYWQVRGDLKFELRLTIEPKPDGEMRSLAVGSFNLHENFFGNTFDITADDGAPAFTGCVGWGLERWVLAAFTQHGFDAADWPSRLRSEIFS